MTDKQFEILKLKIERTMIELESLQAVYRKETGQDFVRPLRGLSMSPEDINELIAEKEEK